MLSQSSAVENKPADIEIRTSDDAKALQKLPADQQAEATSLHTLLQLLKDKYQSDTLKGKLLVSQNKMRIQLEVGGFTGPRPGIQQIIRFLQDIPGISSKVTGHPNMRQTTIELNKEACDLAIQRLLPAPKKTASP